MWTGSDQRSTCDIVRWIDATRRPRLVLGDGRLLSTPLSADQHLACQSRSQDVQRTNVCILRSHHPLLFKSRTMSWMLSVFLFLFLGFFSLPCLPCRIASPLSLSHRNALVCGDGGPLLWPPEQRPGGTLPSQPSGSCCLPVTCAHQNKPARPSQGRASPASGQRAGRHQPGTDRAGRLG